VWNAPIPTRRIPKETPHLLIVYAAAAGVVQGCKCDSENFTVTNVMMLQKGKFLSFGLRELGLRSEAAVDRIKVVRYLSQNLIHYSE
jgi:hypothetical protein